MKIFIRGNGGAFGRDELIRFAESGLRGPWYTGFRPRGELLNCHILRVMDASGRRSEYHGLIEVKPSRVGWDLIQRLNGKRLHGRAVQVRKWFERNRSRDRRTEADYGVFPRERERRAQHERRRLVRVQYLNDLPHALLADGQLRRHVA